MSNSARENYCTAVLGDEVFSVSGLEVLDKDRSMPINGPPGKDIVATMAVKPNECDRTSGTGDSLINIRPQLVKVISWE